MIVSSKGRYALRVMLVLASREEEGFIPLKDITAREGISQKYLESIMTALSKAGLVETSHGKNGGYRLNRPADAYTLDTILELTEGDLRSASCDAACQRSSLCCTRPVWQGLDRLIRDYFHGITLADLMEDQ